MTVPAPRPRPTEPSADPDSSGRRVLDLLENSTRPLTVAQITEGTGLHANTVRSHLALLQEMSRVEAVPEPRTRPGRPKLLYRAVPRGEAADPYRVLAAELAAGISAEEPGVSPGVAAGRRLARTQREKAAPAGCDVTPEDSIGMAVEGLEVLGFETATDPLGDRLYLSNCPFADLARQDRGDLSTPPGDAARLLLRAGLRRDRAAPRCLRQGRSLRRPPRPPRPAAGTRSLTTRPAHPRPWEQ